MKGKIKTLLFHSSKTNKNTLQNQEWTNKDSDKQEPSNPCQLTQWKKFKQMIPDRNIDLY